MQTTFADTILNISLTGPLVRIELGTIAQANNPEGKQEMRATTSQHLVMPLEGFVRAFGLQENVIKKLIADGVLKPQRAANPDVITASGLSQ